LILPLRIHEYLTDAEVASLTDAAKGNPYGHRDATMILTAACCEALVLLSRRSWQTLQSDEGPRHR
jgi:hypothetical protein